MPPKKYSPSNPPFEVSKTVYLQQRWQMCQKIGKAFYSSDLTYEFIMTLQKRLENEKHFEKIIKTINTVL